MTVTLKTNHSTLWRERVEHQVAPSLLDDKHGAVFIIFTIIILIYIIENGGNYHLRKHSQVC